MSNAKKSSKPTKVTVLLHDRELLKRIDAYGAETRRPSRSNAIEGLIGEALDARAKATA